MLTRTVRLPKKVTQWQRNHPDPAGPILCSFHELEETALLSVYAVLFLCYNSITPKGAESLPGQYFFSVLFLFYFHFCFPFNRLDAAHLKRRPF